MAAGGVARRQTRQAGAAGAGVPPAGGRGSAAVCRVALAARAGGAVSAAEPQSAAATQQTHDLLVAWLIEEAERQPVQVTWEDVHWADPSTLEVLGLVIEQAPTVRMLNLLTYRPEFQPPWPMRSHMTPLTLNRLERLQVEALVTHLAGGKVLPAEVMQHVVSKTDGVPLFVEELTKMVSGVEHAAASGRAL